MYNYVLCWKCSILTGKAIVHNRSHIIFKNKVSFQTPLFQTSYLQKSRIERLKNYQHLAVEVKKTRKQTEMYFLAIALSVKGGSIDYLTKLETYLHTSTQLYKSVVLNTLALDRKFLNFCICAHLPSALAVVT